MGFRTETSAVQLQFKVKLHRKGAEGSLPSTALSVTHWTVPTQVFCKGFAHLDSSRDGVQHSQAHTENALHDITELPDISLPPLSLSVRPCLQQKRF